MSNIAIFFTDKEYTNDNGDSITLEEHLYNVDNYCATPDCWIVFIKSAKHVKKLNNGLKMAALV